VRYVGDRVAAVAAETEEIAQRALALIEVEYEELPAILDPRDGMKPGAPVIHDEPDYVPFGNCDPSRNLVARIDIQLGDVDAALARADYVFEGEYQAPKVQQTPIEPFVCITYWDENDRLVIRTSTQVPFHARRLLAPVLGLPIKRIRVIKPRIGGGFGNKQEVMIEDMCAHLTIATGRPSRWRTHATSSFGQHLAPSDDHPHAHRCHGRRPHGANGDGGAERHRRIRQPRHDCHREHRPQVHVPLPGRQRPDGQSHIRFQADIVYTNLPMSGAYRGYGVPQGFFALESQMERIARRLGLDPLEFRLMNVVRPGEEHAMSKAWSEGREARAEIIRTNALAECARLGAELIGWNDRDKVTRRQGDKAPDLSPARSPPFTPFTVSGKGVALVMQGTAIRTSTWARPASDER